jgi:hypothetical protein
MIVMPELLVTLWLYRNQHHLHRSMTVTRKEATLLPI